MFEVKTQNMLCAESRIGNSEFIGAQNSPRSVLSPNKLRISYAPLCWTWGDKNKFTNVQPGFELGPDRWQPPVRTTQLWLLWNVYLKQWFILQHSAVHTIKRQPFMLRHMYTTCLHYSTVHGLTTLVLAKLILDLNCVLHYCFDVPSIECMRTILCC